MGMGNEMYNRRLREGHAGEAGGPVLEAQAVQGQGS